MTSHLLEWLLLKKIRYKKCWQECEKKNREKERETERDPFCPVGGNRNWYSHYEKIVWRFFKILKIKLPHGPAILLLGILPKGNEISKLKTYMNPHIYSSIIYNSQGIEIT